MRRCLPLVSVVALVACAAPASQEVSKTESALNLRVIGRTKGWSEEVAATLVIDSIHEYAPGVRVAQISQRIGGVEVFLGGFGMILGRDGAPVMISGKPVETVHPTSPFKLDPLTTLRTAVVAMTGLTPSSIAPMQGNADYAHFDVSLVGDLRVQSARSRAVWFQGKRLTAAHYIELDIGRLDSTDSVVRSFVVSAVDGEILFEHDLTADDSFTYKVYAEGAGTFVPWAGPHGSMLTPHPTGTLDTTTVVAKEPVSVTLQNVPFSKNDPWLPAGATKTDGNNVNAYADLLAPDGMSGTDPQPATTTAGIFDYAYDATKNPNATPTNINAVATQLFYVGNYMHDWFYDAGFNEAARNHQVDNLGRGGVAKDPLKMEAQDYSGRNNANATTPADGGSPRIQMFLFNGAGRATLTVTAPDTIKGNLTTRSAPFGPANFDITSEVVLVDDGGGTTSDGCEKPFVNAAAVKGKIALIDRGVCAFTDKVLNAEGAGAIGVLIANNSATGGAPYLGGTAGVTIKIPTLSITLADGTKLKGATAPTVRMFREQALDRDGGLDTGIVSHEWGHVLTNRLVGNGNGLLNTQGGGLGEGWSDFTALLTALHASDVTAAAAANWNGTYSVGGWVNGASGAGSYFGIRRYPYSADLTKNPLTFKHIQNGTKLTSDAPIAYGESGSNNAEVHATGEVWSSMMWQCYVGILRGKRHTYEETSKRMRAYLVAGLKVTPVNPTIIQARDALLTAMYAADQEDFKTCAKGFAERGAGVGATGPDAASRTNVGVKESFAVGGDIDVESITLAETTSCDEDGTLDNGETGTVTIKVRNIGTETIEAATGKLTSKSGNFAFVGDGKIALPAMKPFESVEVKIDVTLNNAAPVSKQDIEVAVDAMGLAVPRTITASLPLIVDADTKLESSALDSVDTEETAWKASTGKTTWTRVKDGINQRWSIIGNPDRSERFLVSPPLVVSEDKSFVMTFKHRHGFEQSRSLNWDGGVIEISTDDGVNWVDAGATVYNGTLTTTDNDNPLKGRKAFVFRNAGYPEYAKVTLDLGTTFAGKTVLIRFRSGTDAGTASAPWDVDDIGFEGITNTPFASRVGDGTVCGTVPAPDAGPGPSVTPDPGKDIVEGGACGCEVPRHQSSNVAPLLGLIALAITRRKRATR